MSTKPTGAERLAAGKAKKLQKKSDQNARAYADRKRKAEEQVEPDVDTADVQVEVSEAVLERRRLDALRQARYRKRKAESQGITSAQPRIREDREPKPLKTLSERSIQRHIKAGVDAIPSADKASPNSREKIRSAIHNYTAPPGSKDS